MEVRSNVLNLNRIHCKFISSYPALSKIYIEGKRGKKAEFLLFMFSVKPPVPVIKSF